MAITFCQRGFQSDSNLNQHSSLKKYEKTRNIWGQLLLELSSKSYSLELELSQNPEFKILESHSKILNSGFWHLLTLTLSHNSTEITVFLVNLRNTWYVIIIYID